jgi:NitT/TauT family transport system ATP-binding protein
LGDLAVPEAVIEARQVEKFFAQPHGGKVEVIAPTDLAIYPGQILALLGPSGSGKSTLLRMLTGLAKPSSGEVFWHGKQLDGQVPNVAIVFQSFALYPWLTVLQNVEAPLEARGVSPIERRKRAFRMLDVVGLDGFEMAYPKELSGGMKQRVGFARALVVEPEVLFMDEPFSALDVLTAENLRNELLELWLNKKMPTTAIFIVTHNIEEAVLLADRVIVLGRNPGRIRSDFEVTLPHYRDHKAPRFVELVDYIYKMMTQPDVEHALPTAQVEASQAAKTKYLMLPHARPGGIAGMLEILGDHDGHEDLYHLAEESSMDVDDLLPIVDAARMLGFATLKDSNVVIADTGRVFVDADILKRKVLFRDAALSHIPLLAQMDSVLRKKSDHAIDVDFFHDLLDEHFSENEVKQQLETALHWGRYAEIFDYNSATGRLFLPEATDLSGTTTTIPIP